MKVLVCGSRSWKDGAAIYRRLCELPRGTILLHGKCEKGADALCDFYGRQLGLDVRRFPADWRTHGKRAGILRNLLMLDEGPELVIAWWDGKSRGTLHTITEARRRGIPVEIHRPE